MKTKLSPDIVAAVMEITSLSLATPSAIADVFVDISAHVSGLSIRIHKHGWREHVSACFEQTVYLEYEDSLSRLRSMLDEARAVIAAIPTMPDAVHSSKAEQLREAAAKLLAQADAITHPQPGSP